jgi:magnesium transporter
LPGVPRVVNLPENGPPVVQAAGEDWLGPPPAGCLRWIDIEQPGPDLLEQMRVPFNLHPLAIEDCLTFGQRPKLEEYPGHLFVVIHRLELRKSGLEGNEIHAFLTPGALITVHAEPCLELSRVLERIAHDPTVHGRGIGFVYYLIADLVALANDDVLSTIADSIEDVEAELFAGDKEPSLPRLFALKRSLSAARRYLSPQRDLFATLTKLENRTLGDRNALYFRDVYDKVVRANESIEASRDLASNVLDAHFSKMSQRTNDVMRRLTALSAVFLPLTFITGFFGQNFEMLPFGSHGLMWSVLALCGALPATMLYWFYRSRWL